jgi:hypothetical protein
MGSPSGPYGFWPVGFLVSHASGSWKSSDAVRKFKPTPSEPAKPLPKLRPNYKKILESILF